MIYRIPFQNLAADSRPLRHDITQAIAKVLDSGVYLLGPELAAFEEEFAAYLNADAVVGVSSGLAALKLMLNAYDIGPGDEVIVPGNTYIATWLAISHVGARPVPVDPDFGSRNIDSSLLEAVVTDRTKAVLAVHLYGVPCNMDSLQEFCSRHGLFLFTDAAQSCGAKWDGERSGCLGDASAFSFYPTKNLGALGDAGAVATNDIERAERIRRLRNYGMKDRYHHLEKGDNNKLEELHAAVLRVKLKHLETSLQQRNRLAEVYRQRLSGNLQTALQQIPSQADPAWHILTLTIEERNRVQERLRQEGVQTLVHYPIPPHLTPAYKNDPGNWPKLPLSTTLAKTLISLPLYPSLREEDAVFIVEIINSEARAFEPST